MTDNSCTSFTSRVDGRISSTARRFTCVALGLMLSLQSSAIAFAAENPGEEQQSAQQSAPVKPQVQPPSSTPSSQDIAQESVNGVSDHIPSAPEPQNPAQSSQAPVQQQPSSPQQPVGTAAAPYEKPTGVPGSRPAGAVIAPAKQRRVRAFVIRFALVAAGAAAVGTVVGLSKASHSTP